ncbi:SH3 domain-containing protein [Streptomyces sp. NPDC050636]|uniref:SH3 domain-containing protein n=1 Tax=Streptomyces sp. NPDC050636 TaxID=3154510 RepID=UPI0034467A5A
MTTQDPQGFPGTDTATATAAPTTVQAATHRRTFPIAPGYEVNVRKGPSTDTPVVRQLAKGARIEIHCQRRGQRVSGPCGTSDIWDNIAPGQYVSDAYVQTGSDGPVTRPCTS